MPKETYSMSKDTYLETKTSIPATADFANGVAASKREPLKLVKETYYVAQKTYNR